MGHIQSCQFIYLPMSTYLSINLSICFPRIVLEEARKLCASGILHLKKKRTVEEAREGYRMALTDSGMGFFLTLPEELHDVCPLSPLASASGAAQDQSSSKGLTNGERP
eukprot:793737-Pelagomonas_calceolata.AAC.7